MLRPMRILAVAGSVLLALGLLAGAANREVLDGARFARHADAVRMDPLIAFDQGDLFEAVDQLNGVA
jgi:hypothetical protein